MNQAAHSPFLTFKIFNRPPYRVDETIQVFSNGSLAYFSLAAAESGKRGRAGTFRIQLGKEALAELQQLAANLAALPVLSISPSRGAIQISVTVTTLGKPVSHSLTPGELESLPPLLSQAARTAETLKEQAEAHPFSAVQCSAQLRENNGEWVLLLSCRSLGSERVFFRFAPESLHIKAEAGGAWPEWWRNDPHLSIGLVGSAGKLFDGFLKTARLGKGEKATAVFNQKLPTQRAEGLHLFAEGVISLFEPGMELPAQPLSPFYILIPIAAA